MNTLFKVLIGASVIFAGLFFWGISIEKNCVTGNPDFEKGTGFCWGNGRKDIAEQKKREALEIAKQKEEEKLERRQRKEEEQNKKNKQDFLAMTYICEAFTKEALREPSSYERIESTFYGSTKNSSKRGVVIKYRARNGFGGMNIASAGCMTTTGRAEDLKLTGNLE